MQKNTIITFRNMDASPAIEDHVQQRVKELEDTFPRIVGCNVVIRAGKKKKVTGREFKVQLTLSVPGPDIYIARKIGRSGAAEDVNLAIHKAFDAARRKLKEQARIMDGQTTKHHPILLHGIIDRVFPDVGYGFIKADDGKEVYFERDNLTTGRWEDVTIDRKVRFREAIGNKGPYAMNLALSN